MKLTSIGSVLKDAFPIDGSKPQGLPEPARPGMEAPPDVVRVP